MDRSQAREIRKHLLDATRAFDRATEAISKVGKSEHEPYGKMLFDVSCAIHFRLLPTLHAEHPELKRPPEPPHISSTPALEGCFAA